MLITTAIDYTNGLPHLGHAYEKVYADWWCRGLKQIGKPAFFLTGVDQHGQKIQQSAQKLGIEPLEYVTNLSQEFKNRWAALDINYDNWAETTNPIHIKYVQNVLQNFYDRGLIYKGKKDGWFSVRQEQFITEKDRNEDGTWAEIWGEVNFIEEENYYFKLDIDWLKASISNFDISPLNYKNQLVHAIENYDGGDLCITRPKNRLSWGIETPFDSNFVTYVWFDALLNYCSFAEFKDVTHCIGKDILTPAHGIYWFCILKELGFEFPRIRVHGWLTGPNGKKLSKSDGTGIDPLDELKYGSDVLRFHLLRCLNPSGDAVYTSDELIATNNELANCYGNLLSRLITLVNKTTVKYSKFLLPDTFNDFQNLIIDGDAQTLLSEGLRLAQYINSELEKRAPWKKLKTNVDEANHDLSELCYLFFEVTKRLEAAIPNKAAIANASLFVENEYIVAKLCPPLFPK